MFIIKKLSGEIKIWGKLVRIGEDCVSGVGPTNL